MSKPKKRPEKEIEKELFETKNLYLRVRTSNPKLAATIAQKIFNLQDELTSD